VEAPASVFTVFWLELFTTKTKSPASDRDKASKKNEKKSNFEPGYDIHAKSYSGEGTADLSQRAHREIDLGRDANPKPTALASRNSGTSHGRIDPGEVILTLGTRLRPRVWRCGHLRRPNNIVSLAFVTGLDYQTRLDHSGVPNSSATPSSPTAQAAA